jgi:hypothetical protein
MLEGPSRTPVVLPALRACWALVLLISPAYGLGLGRRSLRRSERLLARGLGARELLQAALLSTRPRSRWVLAGAAVDCTHALSMLALALVRPGWRRAAWPNGLVSLALAAGAVRETRRDRGR